MPQQRLYYEYVDGRLIPYWFVLTFGFDEINWDKQFFYFDLVKPFEYIERSEFDESLIGMSMQLSDLIFNLDHPYRIGINLKSLRKRIERHGVDPYVVKQFILSVPELNDFLAYLPVQRQISFITQ